MKKTFAYLSLPLFLLAVFSISLSLIEFDATRVSAQSETKRYVVIYNSQSSIPNGAETKVSQAGGQVVSLIPEIGALVATSNNSNFAAALAVRDNSVSDVGEDVLVQMIPDRERMNVQVLNSQNAGGDQPVEPPGDDSQSGSEPFYNAFQWDKKRMRASDQGSYSVQQGRPEVVVAVLGTGADVLPVPHVDIAPNLDTASSRSFVGNTTSDGDPKPAAWDDKNGHGSWSLSAVGAPINGIGMSGVAPRVKLVALKVLADTGSGSFASVAKALIYAGNNKFDVASMGLNGFLNRSDQGTQALIKLIQRAVNFARQNGVTPVAALGDHSFNISDGDFMRDFIVVPAEIDGVIGVSATGFFNLKASYSNYGVGKTDISAPGGDFAVQTPTNPAPLHRGNVFGAWSTEACGYPNCYIFTRGTSVATPNAAGVAALIISQYGDFTPDNSKKLHMSPQRVESYLQQTANNQPCPEPRETNYFTVIATGIPVGTQVGAPNQTCQGDAGYNNFFGKGIVDAFKAVTEAPVN